MSFHEKKFQRSRFFNCDITIAREAVSETLGFEIVYIADKIVKKDCESTVIRDVWKALYDRAP